MQNVQDGVDRDIYIYISYFCIIFIVTFIENMDKYTNIFRV